MHEKGIEMKVEAYDHRKMKGVYAGPKRRLQQRVEDDLRPLWPKACGGEGPWRLNVDLRAPRDAPKAYRGSRSGSGKACGSS